MKTTCIGTELTSDFHILSFNRYSIYTLFGYLFSLTPREHFLDELADEEILQEMAKSHEGAEALYSFLDSYKRSGDSKQLESLQAEYARLFDCPADPPVPLCESGYIRGEDRQKLVENVYEQHDNSWGSLRAEPADHLFMELKFMNQLASKTMHVNREKHDNEIIALLVAQESFLEEHLLKWIPDFCEKMTEISTHDYYKGAALLLRDFLRCDAEVIAALKKEFII